MLEVVNSVPPLWVVSLLCKLPIDPEMKAVGCAAQVGAAVTASFSLGQEAARDLSLTRRPGRAEEEEVVTDSEGCVRSSKAGMLSTSLHAPPKDPPKPALFPLDVLNLLPFPN